MASTGRATLSPDHQGKARVVGRHTENTDLPETLSRRWGKDEGGADSLARG